MVPKLNVSSPSLSKMAQRIIDTQVIPIRYLEDSWQPIVMIPTYELQKAPPF